MVCACVCVSNTHKVTSTVGGCHHTTTYTERLHSWEFTSPESVSELICRECGSFAEMSLFFYTFFAV